MIDELTLTLIVIGLTLILLVLIFNHWQARKIRNLKKINLEQNLAALHEQEMTNQEESVQMNDSDLTNINDVSDTDASLDFNEAEVAQSASAEALTTSASNQQGDEQIQDTQHSVSEDEVNLPPSVDSVIDLVVTFAINEIPTSEQLTPPELGKALQIYVLNQDDEWLTLHEAQQASSIKQLVIAMQMVNRDGAMSAKDEERFRDWIKTLESTFVCQAQWIAPSHPVEYAIQLDQFCISVDKTLHLHLIHGKGGRFTGTKFRGLAEASGLALENGIFVFYSENGMLGYSLENLELNPFNSEMLRSVVLKGITFKLDIPRCFKCADVFNQMLLTASKMEAALAAELVDESHRALSEAQLEKIRQQVKLIQTNMSSHGIPAGSPTALRLFS